MRDVQKHYYGVVLLKLLHMPYIILMLLFLNKDYWLNVYTQSLTTNTKANPLEIFSQILQFYHIAQF